MFTENKTEQLPTKHFALMVTLIATAGAAIRFVNINYASLWADELYSVLSVRPGNSWYEILYMQRAYQPPGYFMLLWVWTKLFAYNEFYARLLSVLGGTAAIVVSAWLGRTVKDARLGIIMALIVAFNPVQVWYSLEARFYVYVYCLAAVSLVLYWYLHRKQPRSVWLYLFKAGIDAALCYFHHFGIVFVFAQGLFDCGAWYKLRKHAFFFRLMLGYCFAAVLYAPWVVWGLSEGLAVKQYWLKEINVWHFLCFNFGYPMILTVLALLFCTAMTFVFVRRKKQMHLLFPFLILVVTLVPVVYSKIRFPILVDRYAMVLGPVFFLLMAMALVALTERLKGIFRLPSAALLQGVLLLLFCLPGLYLSLVDKKPLVKQPWREMAHWIQEQHDYPTVPVYAPGTLVKGRSNLDFYLAGEKPVRPLVALTPGKDPKMYLVETSGIWQIADSVWEKVDSFYTRQQVRFNPDYPGVGAVYICKRKPQVFDSIPNSLTQLTQR